MIDLCTFVRPGARVQTYQRCLVLVAFGCEGWLSTDEEYASKMIRLIDACLCCSIRCYMYLCTGIRCYMYYSVFHKMRYVIT